MPIGIADKTWWTSWEAQLLDSDGVLVIDTEAYRKKLKNGAALMKAGKDADTTDGMGIKREADRIIALREERGEAFKVYVIDGKSINADSLLRLLKNDESEANFEGWRRLAEQRTSDMAAQHSRRDLLSDAEREQESVL